MKHIIIISDKTNIRLEEIPWVPPSQTGFSEPLSDSAGQAQVSDEMMWRNESVMYFYTPTVFIQCKIQDQKTVAVLFGCAIRKTSNTHTHSPKEEGECKLTDI